VETVILTEEILVEMMEFVLKYRDNIADHKIFRGTKWA
jgi:hypothetical protein